MASSTVLRDPTHLFNPPKFRSFLSHSTPLSSPSSPFWNSNKILRPPILRTLPPSSTNIVIKSKLGHQPPEKTSGDLPPSSREEAIEQARRSLSSSLSKPLNNPRLAGKLKKQRQPRFRVEIPVLDESPASLASLVSSIFDGISLKRKGSSARILILWPDTVTQQEAGRAFRSGAVQNDVLGSAEGLAWGDVAVVVSPESNRLEEIEAICAGFDPKPVVMVNPKWGADEESELGQQAGGFVASFEVVYSFMGLEVRGVLSRRKGMVFRYAKDGIPANAQWEVLVEEEGGGAGGGELRMVTRFKKRPSVVEVETVLYNLMAANSPVTKSVKFVKDAVSRASGLFSRR
ncbi:uncharacterized protein LOC116264447 [Nymphaea colorata]|uniref:DUF1995 domain-containing protein n=1 Tax=Nymphaea colorata TaxID=210225 RepID=A0A5K0Y324_9MAGN|nr:uncharacterized protein LOC116264447 [Nymphaea colorata]